MSALAGTIPTRHHPLFYPDTNTIAADKHAASNHPGTSVAGIFGDHRH